MMRRKGRPWGIILYPCEPNGPHSSRIMWEADNYSLHQQSLDCGKPTSKKVSVKSIELKVSPKVEQSGKSDLIKPRKKCAYTIYHPYLKNCYTFWLIWDLLLYFNCLALDIHRFTDNFLIPFSKSECIGLPFKRCVSAKRTPPRTKPHSAAFN